MGFEFLLNLLGTLAGTVVYHLLIVLGLLAAFGIVWSEWRKSHAADLRPYVIALAMIMAIHVLALVLAPSYITPGSNLAFFSGPFLYAGEWLSVVLLLWAFVLAQRWRDHARLMLQVLLLLWAGLLAGASAFWYFQSTQLLGMDYTADTWQVPAWYVLAALTAFAGAAFLFQRRPARAAAALAPYAFVLLGVGATLGVAGSKWLGTPLLMGEGIGRLLLLVGYPLFAIDLYQSALRDLDAYRQELQDISQEALRQSQALLFLIEATRSIGETLDLRGMLGRVAENVAMALSTDRVAIFVLSPERLDYLTLVAQYRILGQNYGAPQEIPLQAYQILAVALRQRQLVFGPTADSTPLRPLFDLLGVKGQGPLLLQPLTRQKRTMGVLVACNDHTQIPFSSEQQALATTIAVQIAGAVENSRLYQDLEAKANELATLLKVRETEVRRQEAILESMAEGILVTDPGGLVILVNASAEGILQTPRQALVGENAKDLLTGLPSEASLDPELFLTLTEPLETVLSLDERKIWAHAAPVRMKDGARLGVVAVLQDITREMLAEEAKRDFITSISHELRTPLTAIKGYAELMLSGMAGVLPSAMTQFLGVIRENVVRMNFITENLISVSEIERGRLGLSYQAVNPAKVVGDVTARYREQLAERPLELQLELAENLPVLEADLNRLRSVLDNLLSNAIKFTYPGGKITVGCRAVEDELGESSYLSFWVSDTGVGIDPEEQGRIWERFYRADNPLSLEAGGLGIGLAIVKALVEAHGGRVWVDSVPAVGSTFTVLIPIHRMQSFEGMESRGRGL